MTVIIAKSNYNLDVLGFRWVCQRLVPMTVDFSFLGGGGGGGGGGEGAMGMLVVSLRGKN